jgi:HK97 gp10 family phage protein
MAISRSIQLIENKGKRYSPVDTGKLRQSIRSQMESAARGLVEVGSPYGFYVHEGTRYMRARPFMTQAVNDVEGEINDIFNQAVAKALS